MWQNRPFLYKHLGHIIRVTKEKGSMIEMTTVRERLLTIRLTEMINTYPDYAKKLGISIESNNQENKETEENNDEVQ